VPLEPFIKDPKLGTSASRVSSAAWWATTARGMGRWSAFPGAPPTGCTATAGTCSRTPRKRPPFKSKYGYELKFPETWQQFRDAAQFFTRDTNKDGKIDFWGVGNGFSADGDAYEAFSDIYRTFNAVKDGSGFWTRA